MGIISY